MDKQWYLESFRTDGEHVDFVITQLPCRIGRSKENELVIADLDLSRIHAVLARDISGKLRLIDLNSTNGTFVNRHRVEGYCLLNENDIIHFGNVEFKLRMRWVEQRNMLPFDEMSTMLMTQNMALAEHIVPNEAEFNELIMGHGMSGAVQPIVDAHTRQTVGYELFGRANHPLLPNSPIELFSLAEEIGRELDLSKAFRDFVISNIVPLYVRNTLFINAHPKETFSESLFTSLKNFRQAWPEQNIVVEIHESALTEIAQLQKFAKRLALLDIHFAYDDFGAGRARLLELAEVPAHYVKFDIALVSRLHQVSPRKRKLVKDLVQMVLSAGSVPLAEGVECEEEAQACIDAGFQLIQGYLTGEPIIVDSVSHPQ